MTSRLPLYKVVVLGDGGVGKTCLTSRLCYGHFVETYDPTLEDSFRKQCVIDGQPCMLEVLDTAGQEEYSALREQWIRDGDAFLLVYSITMRKSFEAVRALRRQIQQVKQFPMDATLPIILVGNKCDLASDRDVSTKEGEVSAKDMQVGFLETSAKEATNVEAAYYEAVRRVRKQQDSLQRSASPYADSKSQYSQSKMGSGKWKTRITKLFKADK